MQHDANTTSRFEEKLLILQANALSSYATDISCINLFTKKIPSTFDFWPSQSLKLTNSNCFHVFMSSFVLNSFLENSEGLAVSTSTFPFFKRYPYIPIFSLSA